MEIFGATTDTFISRVYKKTIEVLNSTCDRMFHGNCFQPWGLLFPQFEEAIRDKLNKPQYGELLYDNIGMVGSLLLVF
jgi:hypothetical protein